MGSGIFGIGVSGLNAAQAGLVTTGHNIANANTPGYHRQAIVQSTPAPLLTGGGFFGQG
ncbi:MAG: flagellar basal body protein, partial [Burkholderiales bacterium]|nr:flagellar basal body protein [Burkholderiales bacterium]